MKMPCVKTNGSDPLQKRNKGTGVFGDEHSKYEAKRAVEGQNTQLGIKGSGIRSWRSLN